MSKKLVIVDMMNMAMRSYHGFAVRERLATADGKLTFLCYGVALGINRLFEQFKPDYLVFAADSKGKTFRHEMYEGYKSNRGDAPLDFVAQLPDLYRMLEAYGIPVVKHDATEADDVIGTLAKKYATPDLHVYIVSGDKDFMQCINDNVSIIRPSKGGGYDVVSYAECMQKFACTPDKVVDALALIGDAVDMVPGVKGIGEKGAAALVKSFGTIENMYQNLHYIKPALAQKLAKSRDAAFMSKKLVTIKTDVPVEVDFDAAKVNTSAKPELLTFFAEMEFQSLMVQGSNLAPEIPNLNLR